MNKIALIVDDDRTERRIVANILRSALDLTPLEAENGKDALRLLDKDHSTNIKLVILDLEMPVMGGLETLPLIRRNYPDLPVIILTGGTDLQDAVSAMRMGAVDFLSKPLETARLEVSARNALKISLMSREITRLKRKTESAFSFSDLIGYETGLAESVKIGKKAAACDLPVLLTGETGTGKEMFAGAIHGESRRADNPFITVNCGAIPEKLVESILFGHEKGAFTGAVNKASGKFQEANGGTIFLDEIGELPLDAQVKLLRALQQKEIEPVGAAKTVPVDVRVISATNRDLAEDVREGRFREDLYFRLNVLHIDLPPLRMRKNDIAILAQNFMEQFCAGQNILPKEISGAAIDKLKTHSWPGNVRELENIIHRTMALGDGDRLEPEHFSFLNTPPEGKAAPARHDKPAIFPIQEDGSFKPFKILEQEIITLALSHHDNNISQTARALGIAKSTLYTKLGNPGALKSA